MRTSLVTLLCIITLLASSVKADTHAFEHKTAVATFYLDQHHQSLNTPDLSKSSEHQTQSCQCGDCYYADLIPSQLFILVPNLFQFDTEYGSEANNCHICSNFKGLVPQTLFRPPKSS